MNDNPVKYLNFFSNKLYGEKSGLVRRRCGFDNFDYSRCRRYFVAGRFADAGRRFVVRQESQFGNRARRLHGVGPGKSAR